MPVLEDDDFGKSFKRTFPRAPGASEPSGSIGSCGVADLPEVQPVRIREPDLGMSALDLGSVYCSHERPERRKKKAVYDGHGVAVDSTRPSDGGMKPRGPKYIDFRPQPKTRDTDGYRGLRHFEHAYEATGLNNPKQWDSVPEPGVRPSHPVSCTGIVALEQRKVFPEHMCRETADPGNPRLARAPFGGKAWGGWGTGGAPGRKPIQQPWDSLQPHPDAVGGQESAIRMSDARRQAFPEQTYGHTAAHTCWHLDPRDADPVTIKRIHFNAPRNPAAHAAAAAIAAMPAAGKPSGLPLFDAGRALDSARAMPHTAR